MSKDKLKDEIRDMLRPYDCRLIGLPEMKVVELRMVHGYLKKCRDGAFSFDWKEFTGIARLFDCRLTLYSEFHNLNK